MSVNKSNCAAFRSVLVTKSLRGQGIGSTLFALRLLSAREKGIEVVFGTVAPDNFHSLRLFLKHGFQEIERRQIFDFTSLRILMYESIVQMIVPQASESENNLFAKNKISDYGSVFSA